MIACPEPSMTIDEAGVERTRRVGLVAWAKLTAESNFLTSNSSAYWKDDANSQIQYCDGKSPTDMSTDCYVLAFGTALLPSDMGIKRAREIIAGVVLCILSLK